MAKIRIIVIGGGFAGVACAKALAKRLPRDTHQVVLFNKENHMVFHPLLAEVAGASINPEAEAAAPLRQMLPGVMCRAVIRQPPKQAVAYPGGGSPLDCSSAAAQTAPMPLPQSMRLPNSFDALCAPSRSE
jgi:2-polyprenyl-6-methoxyphenol hydroxylase-like FAD-dependent oxidoreductase